MHITLYQEYENDVPNSYTSELMILFRKSSKRVSKEKGNTLEKALQKIGRDDIVKKCIFNVELVTDDVEKAVAKVRIDQPGFDSLKEELGPSRDTSLRRNVTLDPKLDPDYEEPDRMKDSESLEDLVIIASTPEKPTKPHVTITNGTVFNGTSTPKKDKYASDEKEFEDMMADFVQHKYQESDPMINISQDDTDDEFLKRQKIIADASKLVSDVTEEAERRAQELASQALELRQPGHDSAEIDGTVERHATSAPTMQPVPAPRFTVNTSKANLELNIKDAASPQTRKTTNKSKIPARKIEKPHIDDESTSPKETLSPKSKIPIKLKSQDDILSRDERTIETRRSIDSKLGLENFTETITTYSSHSIPSEELEHLQKMLPSGFETDVSRQIVTTSSQETDPGIDELLKDGEVVTSKIIKKTMMTTSDSLEPEVWTETTTKTLPDGKQETWRSVTSGSLQSEIWDTQCSLDTSPGSGNGDLYPKNENYRHEVNSDTDSEGSPQPRRRSLSKRRTLGSSSGSDVALHEGAELSPLEDDQGTSLTANILKSDFLQQSEPSYMETTTTEIDPETNERITRTTRVVTTTGSSGITGGADELRESMQKIVDQFMVEDRKGQ